MQAGPSLYTQVNTLSSQIKDEKTSAKDRKIALIFLIHIMGDLAQPLHVGRAEDLGGNKINVTYFGDKTNLHSVWDGKLVDSQKYSYTEYSKLLDIKSKEEVAQIQSGTWKTGCMILTKLPIRSMHRLLMDQNCLTIISTNSMIPWKDSCYMED
jgi:hypothetical protein